MVEIKDSPDHGMAVRVNARTAKRDILLLLVLWFLNAMDEWILVEDTLKKR